MTIEELLKKKNKERIAMLTAYDYSFATILDEAKIDIILVGDSLGMVMLGYDNTLPVSLEDILRATQSVRRAINYPLLVADMPFLSYKVDIKESIYNAGRLIKEGGCHAVKLEGTREIIPTIEALIAADIPVMGHIGLMPQQICKLGRYKVYGRDEEEAEYLINTAEQLAEAGCFAIVLECITYTVAKKITEKIPILTIGCGSGPYCDGQVLVLHDILGLYKKIKKPKFVRQYIDLYQLTKEAVQEYIKQVKNGTFPTLEHSYGTNK